MVHLDKRKQDANEEIIIQYNQSCEQDNKRKYNRSGQINNNNNSSGISRTIFSD